jgi:hypothetical protein
MNPGVRMNIRLNRDLTPEARSLLRIFNASVKLQVLQAFREVLAQDFMLWVSCSRGG